MYPDPDAPRRFGALDAALLALVAAALLYAGARASQSLVYTWDWGFLAGAFVNRGADGALQANILLEGLFSTLRISVLAMALAVIIGVALGVAAASGRLFARAVPAIYVALIRNAPPLVFIFVFYFFVADFVIGPLQLRSGMESLPDGLRAVAEAALGPASLIDNTVSGVLCLAFLEAAYIAEIVRAGIAAVPSGQREAARSLGLSPWRSFRLVVLPQAVTITLPSLANQFIILVKNSAIISLISVQELTFMATEVAVSTGRRFETWIAVAAVYFMLCFALSRLFARLERRARERSA